jgi:RNA polymerase sigma-70 factor (ECF subfamily)
MMSPRVESTRSAFRAFEAELDYVHRSLLRHGVAPADAEDLAQDVFLIVWRRWADFDRGRPLRPWLAGIAFKVASDHLKRRRRWEPRAWLDPPDHAPGGEELLSAARARALAMRCLAALDERQRALIVLHDLDGVPMREIARLLSVPLFTAYSRLRAARRAFTDVVDGELRASRRPVPGAAALLELERVPPPVPADVRRRSLSRLRALLPLTPASDRPLSPDPTLPWPVVVAAASTLTAVLLLAWLPVRRSTTTDVVARSPAPAAAEVRPARAFLRPPTLLPPPALLPPLAPPSPRRVVHLERGLVGHWSFDDDPAGLALDRSGHDNSCRLQDADGRATSGRFVDGISGLALQLDGRRFLTCARAEPLAGLRTAVTISLWVRPAAPRPEPQVLIARAIGSSVERYFSIALRGDAVELVSHTWKSATRRRLPPGRGPWIHIAALHKDDGRTALHVDGIEVGRSNKSRRVHLGGGSDVLTIGGTGAADGLPFAGALDEVRIYDRALGRAELRALAAARPGAPPEALLSADKIAHSHQ